MSENWVKYSVQCTMKSWLYEVWKVSLKICTVYNEELTMRSEKWVYIYVHCTMKSWLLGLKSEFKYTLNVKQTFPSRMLNIRTLVIQKRMQARLLDR